MLPRDRRQRRRVLFRLALLGGCRAVPASGSKIWRIVCNSPTSEEWRLCDVGFFTDTGCSQAPPQQMSGFLESSSSVSRIGVSADAAFYEWRSSCESCQAGEAYLGVRFAQPAVVRCVYWDHCPATTTSPPPTPAPTPTPTPAPSGSSSSSGSSPTQSPTPAPTPGPGFGGAGGTTTNPFLNLGGFRLRRRLDAGSCNSVALQRSDGGAFSDVAQWQSPDPGTPLHLGISSYRPDLDPPQVTGWSPASTSCGRCGSSGLQAQAELRASFSERVFAGGGRVRFERGGMADLSISIYDSAWFQFSENQITIRPQQALGASGSCGKVRFEQCSVVDADGECYLDIVGYTYCVADLRAPELQNSDPPDGGVANALSPRLRLAFDEEVSVAPDAQPATLVPVGYSDTGTVTSMYIELTGPDVQVFVWNAMTGATEVEITVPVELPPELGYRLRVPASAIVDKSGNAWPGGQLDFVTPCGDEGCRTTTPAASTAGLPAGEDLAAEEESKPVVLYLVLAVVLLCCGAGFLFFWKLYVRSLFRPDEEEHSSKVTQSPDEHPYQFTPKGQKRSMAGASGGWSASGSPTHQGPRQAGWSDPSAGGGQPASPQSGQTMKGSFSTMSGTTRSAPAASGNSYRSKEAEDVPRRGAAGDRPPAPPTSANGVRPGPFTEESSAGGGWVRQVDQTTGRPYWMHYKTRETRWDPPPRAGATFASNPHQNRPKAKAAPAQEQPRRAGSAEQQQQQQPPPRTEQKAAPPQSAAGIDTSSLEEAEEVAKVKAQVNAQLESTHKEDIASRKKTFKFLVLKWHPDKNQDNKELATQIFQFLQSQKDWYLKE